MKFWNFFLHHVNYNFIIPVLPLALDTLSLTDSSQPPNWSNLPPVSSHKIALYTMHTARWTGPNTASTLLLNTLSWFPHAYKTNWNSLVRNSRGLFQSYFLFFPNTKLPSSTHLISSFFLQIKLALSYLCTFILPLPHTRMPSFSSPTLFFSTLLPSPLPLWDLLCKISPNELSGHSYGYYYL